MNEAEPVYPAYCIINTTLQKLWLQLRNSSTFNITRGSCSLWWTNVCSTKFEQVFFIVAEVKASAVSVYKQ